MNEQIRRFPVSTNLAHVIIAAVVIIVVVVVVVVVAAVAAVIKLLLFTALGWLMIAKRVETAPYVQGQ